MERRHQVFVSSTFLDLADERAAVISVLLNMDAMPAGMELFPAADDDAWTLIQQVIRESDYYLLVVGGRYGAVDDASQLSYTEKEFDYAVSLQKPVMAFLHGNPGSIALDKSEQEEEARKKLARFRDKVEACKHVKYWESAKDLAGLVAQSFPKLQRAHPAAGWVRGDVQTSSESLEELNLLRKRLEEAERQLSAARRGPPPGTEGLAQGRNMFQVPVAMSVVVEDAESYHRPSIQIDVKTSWDEVFAGIGTKLLDEADQDSMRHALEGWFAAQAYDEAWAEAQGWAKENGIEVESQDIEDGRIYDPDFETILLQFRALGLIARSERKRSLKDTDTYWTLTPYGDDHLTTLRAITRGGDNLEVEEQEDSAE